VFDRYPEKDVASFLWTFAEHVRSTQRALFRGEVIGPSNPLFSGVKANAIYASSPAFFEEEFATCHETAPPTVIVWLMPLVGKEPEFVSAIGWEAFEDTLERLGDVDFWNLEREPIQSEALH